MANIYSGKYLPQQVKPKFWSPLCSGFENKTMSNKGPGLYADIGKKARDLLYKDYAHQPPTYFQYQRFNFNLDLSCETPEILPGLTTFFRFLVPDSCKVELRFLQDYIGIAAGVGVKADEQGPFKGNGYNPFVNFSGAIGSGIFSFGTDVCFDLSTRTFAYINAGLSFNGDILDTALTLDDNLNKLRASCYRAFNPLTSTAFAAELEHSFSDNGSTTLTVGAQHELFPFALIKARIDTELKLGAGIQLDLWQKLFLGVSGEVDFREANQVSKVGFSMAFGR